MAKDYNPLGDPNVRRDFNAYKDGLRLDSPKAGWRQKITDRNLTDIFKVVIPSAALISVAAAALEGKPDAYKNGDLNVSDLSITGAPVYHDNGNNLEVSKIMRDYNTDQATAKEWRNLSKEDKKKCHAPHSDYYKAHREEIKEISELMKDWNVSEEYARRWRSMDPAGKEQFRNPFNYEREMVMTGMLFGIAQKQDAKVDANLNPKVNGPIYTPNLGNVRTYEADTLELVYDVRAQELYYAFPKGTEGQELSIEFSDGSVHQPIDIGAQTHVGFEAKEDKLLYSNSRLGIEIYESQFGSRNDLAVIYGSPGLQDIRTEPGKLEKTSMWLTRSNHNKVTLSDHGMEVKLSGKMNNYPVRLAKKDIDGKWYNETFEKGISGAGL